MKFAIIGRTSTLIDSANLLISKGHELELVVTCKAPPEYGFTHQEFEDYSNQQGAKYMYAPRFTQEVISEIPKELDFAISVNYVSIIPKAAISCFKVGVLNTHTGDLPRYRGNAVVAWAMLNGEEKIVSCIHKMEGGSLDSGDILVKSNILIDINTKIREIYEWFFKITPLDFLEAVESLEKDSTFYLEKQSKLKEDILRCYPRTPEDARIDWTKDSVDTLRLINASGFPFEGAFTFYKGKKIFILDAELLNDGERYLGHAGQISKVNKDGTIAVLAGKSKLLIKSIRVQEEEECLPSSRFKSIRIRFT